MINPFKRLKVEEDDERISWRNPKFADWNLTWGNDSWSVHRCVIVGGSRPAHFFADAAREDADDARSTELSGLLPEVCKVHMERVLDFLYGAPLGDIVASVVMPLFKVADVLQCPKLRNELIDSVENVCLMQSGTIEMLLKDACSLDLFDLAETLVKMLPLSTFTALGSDLLDVDSVPLMRAVARRIAQATISQWGFFVGHGQVRADGSMAIALPNSPQERSRKGYWCIGTGMGEVLGGSFSWKLRLDHVPLAEANPHWEIALGVVSGDPQALATCSNVSDMLLVTNFKINACLTFGRGSTDRPWLVLLDNSFVPGAVSVPVACQRASRGDIFTVTVRWPSNSSNGDIEWELNGVAIARLESRLPIAPYRVVAELRKQEYKPESIGVTLLEGHDLPTA